ncbi:MAG: transposase [bacterium]
MECTAVNKRGLRRERFPGCDLKGVPSQGVAAAVSVAVSARFCGLFFLAGQPKEALCLQWGGFSLHAARALEAHDREGLERLLRYGARAPIAASRLSIDEGGRVVYELTKPWGVTRATVLRLSPSDFLRRLAMLIPAPYQRSREKVQQAAPYSGETTSTRSERS